MQFEKQNSPMRAFAIDGKIYTRQPLNKSVKSDFN